MHDYCEELKHWAGSEVPSAGPGGVSLFSVAFDAYWKMAPPKLHHHPPTPGSAVSVCLLKSLPALCIIFLLFYLC